VIRVLLLGVLLLLVARAFWRLVDGIIEVSGGLPPGRRRGRQGRPKVAAVKLVRDPVCGTHVPTGTALSTRDGGGIHYFCSEQCRLEFLARG
jgi:YHS domain-containing protein